MGEIAMYEALIEAGASKERAQAAVNDLARAEDVATKTDLADLKAEMIKWMVSLWLGGIGLMIAVMILVLRFFLPGAA